MSAKLIAEYDVADHLVVYSEGRISIWQRAASLRPARRRIREVVKPAPHQQRAAAVQARYAARIVGAHDPAEEAAEKLRRARERSMRAFRLSL